MRVIIALTLAKTIPLETCDYVGADRGALILAQHKIHMKFAVGDFDSVKKEDMTLIHQYADEIIQLNPIKDDSDSESALRHCIERGYDDIVMVGAFGGRMDHSYYNLRLAFAFENQLTLLDDKNKVYVKGVGKYRIAKEGYPYISFFTDGEAIISLDGFEYPLKHRHLDQSTIYTLSNSILQETGTLIVEKGKILVMQTKD